MILSRKDYKKYIKEDRIANIREEKTSAFYRFLKHIANYIVKTDDIRAYEFCKSLRKYEYALNRYPHSLLWLLYKEYCHIKYHRQCIKCNLYVVPNTVGYGLKIQHIKGGGCVIVPNKIGNYFSIRQYTTVGKANGDDCPIIGDNVTLGANVTVIGGITIGDNCIIGAGSVVVKSVPPNSIVVGNPGRIIGTRIVGKRY